MRRQIIRLVRRRVKVWHVACVLTLGIYLIITSRDKFETKLPKKAASFQAPKLNVHLSKGLAHLKGDTFKDIGTISTNINMEEVPCVRFKSTAKNTKICIYDVVKDRYVSESLAKYGTWEPDQLHDLETLLKKDKQLGLIDIGANLGAYTLTAAAMGRKVLAVEANNGATIRLQKSVQVNRYTDRVTLIEGALSSTRGYSFMFVPQGNAAGAYPHIIPKQFITPLDVKNHRVVKNLPIDDLVRFIDVNKAIIHIDIGGKEPMVIAHSRLFDIIYISSIFMSYTYNESLRKPIQIALEELELKGFLPKAARMDLHSLDLGDFENWPKNILWMRKRR